MDKFDNFFGDDEDNREPVRQYTPVYHTPDQTPPPAPPKKNTALIISVVISIIMCLAIIINVIVIAALKDSIASSYAAQMEKAVREQYSQAIQDELEKTDIVDRIVEEAADSVVNQSTRPIGEIAADYMNSVGVMKSYIYDKHNEPTGEYAQGSSFIIGYSGTTGYLVTNAHMVKYEKAVSGSTDGIVTMLSYEYAYFDKFIVSFNDGSEASLSLLQSGNKVAVGDFLGEHIESTPTHPDLAILTFVASPAFQAAHPAIKINAEDDDIKIGSKVGVIGNAHGLGLSITSGSISGTGLKFAYSGAGTFFMTDAAVNSGNSGGPMLNEKGIVVGICSMGFSPAYAENMTFFISSETLVDFIELVQTSLRVTIPYTAV